MPPQNKVLVLVLPEPFRHLLIKAYINQKYYYPPDNANMSQINWTEAKRYLEISSSVIMTLLCAGKYSEAMKELPQKYKEIEFLVVICHENLFELKTAVKLQD